MARAEPGKHARRDWLRPVPEHKPPPQLAEEAVPSSRRGAAADRGRRRARRRLLPARASGYLAGHAAAGRPGSTHRPGHRAGGAGHSRELADVGGGPFLHTPSSVPTVANAGHYARLVAETARRAGG